jgi:hypothetical protein
MLFMPGVDPRIHYLVKKITPGGDGLNAICAREI